MSTDKEEWMEDVFQSMKGSQRATPPADLFNKIEQEIYQPKGRVVPFKQWQFAAAAAVLLLIGNALSVVYYKNSTVSFEQDSATIELYSEPLVNSYQIY